MADRERLRVRQRRPAGVEDRHVVGKEPPATFTQQAQHGSRLAGVGECREHDAATVDVEARRVQEHVATRHEHEPQQRFHDVRVEHMRRSREHRPGDDVDDVAHLDVEVRAAPTEVFLVRDRRRRHVLRDPRPATGGAAPEPTGVDDDVCGDCVVGGEAVELGESYRRLDAHDAVHVVSEQPGPPGVVDGRGSVLTEVDDQVDRSGTSRCRARPSIEQVAWSVDRQARSWEPSG